MSDKTKEKERVLDCRGVACPQPVILTKRALDKVPAELTVLVDNLAAKENVAKFATASGYGVSIESEDGLYHLRLLARTAESGLVSGNLQTELLAAGERPVFLITQNTLGQDSVELGAILMKSFFVSLCEMTPQPRAIMLLNTGVYLAAEGSPVLDKILELSRRGVNIMVCGTCLDYFKLKDELAVGVVTNMYSILMELKGPGRAITL